MVSAALIVAFLTIVVVAFELIVAGVVLAAGPRRGANRTLAALIVFKALSVPPGVFGTLVDDRTLDYWATLIIWVIAFGALAAYPRFLGYALETPLVKPFRRTDVRLILNLLAFAGALTIILVPTMAMGGPPVHMPGHGWIWADGPLLKAGLVAYLSLVVFGFVAAISGFRRTIPGTMSRRRAKAYLIAFGTQDVGVALALIYWLFNSETVVATGIVNAVLQLAFGILVSFALLRFQLFDFELKLKAAVARSTVAAILVSAFIVTSAIAQQYLQQYGILIGGATVGALLIAIGPIRRAANAMADRLFPGVSRSADYVTRKKVEVYREALREALAPGADMDAGTHSRLRDLRASLGLTRRDHDVILAALQTNPGPSRPATIAPGATILGKYRVERELGAGGSGHAFLAVDLRMDRRIVLKVIPVGEQAALLREARASAAIEHPNVVRIYDVEEVQGQALLVMEYIDGGSLKERLSASGPLSEGAFARIADDLLAALEAVHATGAVHRDIKPSNVLLTREGRAKLADFGIARTPGFETTIGGSQSGTVKYMSPEQARGRRLTAASDLYSAAATMYEAKTGSPVIEPLPEESVVEMRMRVGALRDFKGSVKPSKLRTWFARALNPDDRYATASEMRRALAAALK